MDGRRVNRSAESSFLDTIVGRRGSLRSILGQVEAVAGTNTTVLITGETGTGKEVIARAIHENVQEGACQISQSATMVQA